ncbi:MAG TPA: hypothetical protein VG797_03745 [Phycisphaerales bacterium]|nr:hypothetical protein [Phycisphaerales bacterium]
MHIVTKFLVVVAAVLSVLLAGLAIAYTSNADRIRREIGAEKDRSAKAEAQVAEINAQADSERNALQTKIASLESSITELSGQVARFQSENAGLRAESNELRQASATHSSQIDQFTAVVQTYAELNKAQSEELAKLRDRELQNARREIELSDRINDLSSQLEVCTETGRSLQEQLVTMRDDLARAQAGGAAAAAGAGEMGGPIRAPRDFRARVVSVQKAADGTVMIGIDAGANDQLRERMKLSVVRDQFLATMILTKVDANEAVGRVDLVNPHAGTEIKVGDVVQAGAL